ncbi:MAG: hypothetical protein H0W59_01070 [Chloroflexia bacterium]|jgi:hypothetical protein|nr:hypothetical protein [Chloroflexia bacterium]
MDDSTREERAARIRHARQVLAGTDVQRPTEDPMGYSSRFPMNSSLEFRYLIVVAVLIVISAIVYAIWGLAAASAVLLLLSVSLMAGWFIL